MTQSNDTMDANVDFSTQVNDTSSVTSQNVKSVSEMDDYSDFMGEEEGLRTDSSMLEDDYENIAFSEEPNENPNPQEAGFPNEKQGHENVNPEDLPWKERSQFFQSQYDTMVNESQRMRQELELLRQGVQSSPEDIRQQVINSLMGQSEQRQTEESYAPEAPVMPVMPKDFDNYEAQTDPSSESAKYIKAQQEYQGNLVKYQQDLVQYNINKAMDSFKQEQQAIAMQEQQRIQQTQMRMQMENNLVTMGMSKEMHSDFGQWLNSPDSIKPIVNMFMQMKRGTQQNANMRNTQLQRNRQMPRGSVNVNNASQPLNNQQQFNMGRKEQLLDDY